MNSRRALTLGPLLAVVTTFGTQLASYGLVYPAGARGNSALVVGALAIGAALVSVAVLLAFRALRRARGEAERFVGLLGLVLSGYLWLVVWVGFGLPALFLSPRD